MITNAIVSFVAFAGALAIGVLMVETTKRDHGMPWDTGQRSWAMARRAVYAMVAIALFMLGVATIEMPNELPPMVALAVVLLGVAVVFFPAVRAAGVINQDRWVGFRRRHR